MPIIIKDISIAASRPSTYLTSKAAIFIAFKVTPKVTPIAAPEAT